MVNHIKDVLKNFIHKKTTLNPIDLQCIGEKQPKNIFEIIFVCVNHIGLEWHVNKVWQIFWVIYFRLYKCNNREE